MNTSIVSVGAWLPDEVRDNDWWPADVVAQWRREVEALKDQVKKTNRSAQALVDEAPADPFNGARRRRVAPPAMPAYEAEIAAAHDALKRAGMGPGDVDLLLSFSYPNDSGGVANSPRIHHGLGLARSCAAMEVNGTCDALGQQLALADGLIRTGRIRTALLVQSCLITRLMVPEAPFSAWFGDAATAVVVTASDRPGLRAIAHAVDGSVFPSIALGQPGERWYDAQGPVRQYLEGPENTRRMIAQTVPLAGEVVGRVLASAEWTPDSIAFYAPHQPTAWFREASRQGFGLVNARSIDTFSEFGSCMGCNVPLGLYLGETRGLLSRGDRVAAVSIAAGMHVSGFALEY
jgi:3-oxoacyl-[acyl-carrier-protein] synthase-3